MYQIATAPIKTGNQVASLVGLYASANLISRRQNYTVFQKKRNPFYLYDNFIRCGPI